MWDGVGTIMAKTISAKRAALREALAGRTVEEAASTLGCSPRQLYRLKRALLTERQPEAPKLAAPPPAKPVTKLSVLVPKHVKDWLEVEALKRKQRDRLPRLSVAPVVVELVEEAMRREQGAADAGAETRG